MQRFGSSKPVSASELNEARSALRLLKDHMKTDPPKYFPGAIDDFQPSQPPSNFRKAFKPSVQNQPPPAQAKPIKHQYRQPTNMAKESESGVAV
jgi:hypothetical protein